MFLVGWRRQCSRGVSANASNTAITSSENLTPSPSLRRSYHAAASTTSSSASGRTTTRQVIVLSASVCEPSTLRAVSTNQDQRDAPRILIPPMLRPEQTATAHQVRWPYESEVVALQKLDWEVPPGLV